MAANAPPVSLIFSLWRLPGTPKTALLNSLELALRCYNHPDLEFVLEKKARSFQTDVLLRPAHPLHNVNYEFWTMGRQQPVRPVKKSQKGMVQISHFLHSVFIYNPPEGERNHVAVDLYKEADILFLELDARQLRDPEIQRGVIAPAQASAGSRPTLPVSKSEIDLSEFVLQSRFFRVTLEETLPIPSLVPGGQVGREEYWLAVNDFLSSFRKAGGMVGRLKLVISVYDDNRVGNLKSGGGALEIIAQIFGSKMKALLRSCKIKDEDCFFLPSGSSPSAIATQSTISDGCSSTSLPVVSALARPVYELLEQRERMRFSGGTLVDRILNIDNARAYISYFDGSKREPDFKGK